MLCQISQKEDENKQLLHANFLWKGANFSVRVELVFKISLLLIF